MKVYVHSPANVSTGGVELLHQFVDVLRQDGRDASVIYHQKNGEIDLRAITPSEYNRYKIKIVSSVEDTPENVEVFPEGLFNIIPRSGHLTRKVLWWLSVDNLYSGGVKYLSLSDLWSWRKGLAAEAFMRRLRHLFVGRNEFRGVVSLTKVMGGGICACQSHYIYDHVKRLGAPNVCMLSDYVNTAYLGGGLSPSKRKDIVVYNPKKGLAFTKKLIARSPELTWIAIENMDRDGVRRLLSEAKIYVDFGNHPGKDRLPRECAMCGCCVITGMQGSAAYTEDVPIPSEYKFDERSARIETIIDAIKDALVNFEVTSRKFDAYRARIANEQAIFENQVRALYFNLERDETV